ncbi:MAG: hypothetical protein ACRD0K_20935 [Egibacteraceae bacterium]
MTDVKRIIRDRRATGCDASPTSPEQDSAWRALPLYGRRPADVVLVAGAGCADVVVEPLDRPALWSAPRHGSRCAVLIRRR